MSVVTITNKYNLRIAYLRIKKGNVRKQENVRKLYKQQKYILFHLYNVQTILGTRYNTLLRDKRLGKT
jgi:hypothetical protein